MNEKSHKTIIKIMAHAQKAVDYALDKNDWWDDDKSLEAIVFNLAQIGELVRFVDDTLQNKYSQINWAAMRGLRNRIIHDYDYINPIVIKSIVSKDLPRLIINLKAIIDYEI